jgi:signal peptidase II
MTLTKKSVIFISLILIVDQALKFWVKTHLKIGDEIPLFGDWGKLLFIENNGMAFGWEFGGKIGKLLLSLLRIFAIVGIGWFLSLIIREKHNTAFILAVSAIFAGALGNMIDSAFYGVIFSESFFDHAIIFPHGGGYSSLFHGRVVDMFYFPIIETNWPSWSPIRPGESLIFFRPVFNIADSAITCGVFAILLFQKKMLGGFDKLS